MGKKRSRKTKTSKGLHSAVSKAVIHAVKQSIPYIDKSYNKLKAWRKGQNPWITIENVGGPADRLFRRVRANTIWGNPKNLKFNIYLKKEKNAPRVL